MPFTLDGRIGTPAEVEQAKRARLDAEYRQALIERSLNNHAERAKQGICRGSSDTCRCCAHLPGSQYWALVAKRPRPKGTPQAPRPAQTTPPTPPAASEPNHDAGTWHRLAAHITEI